MPEVDSLSKGDGVQTDKFLNSEAIRSGLIQEEASNHFLIQTNFQNKQGIAYNHISDNRMAWAKGDPEEYNRLVSEKKDKVDQELQTIIAETKLYLAISAGVTNPKKIAELENKTLTQLGIDYGEDPNKPVLDAIREIIGTDAGKATENVFFMLENMHQSADFSNVDGRMGLRDLEKHLMTFIMPFLLEDSIARALDHPDGKGKTRQEKIESLRKTWWREYTKLHMADITANFDVTHTLVFDDEKANQAKNLSPFRIGAAIAKSSIEYEDRISKAIKQKIKQENWPTDEYQNLSEEQQAEVKKSLRKTYGVYLDRRHFNRLEASGSSGCLYDLDNPHFPQYIRKLGQLLKKLPQRAKDFFTYNNFVETEQPIQDGEEKIMFKHGDQLLILPASEIKNLDVDQLEQLIQTIVPEKHERSEEKPLSQAQRDEYLQTVGQLGPMNWIDRVKHLNLTDKNHQDLNWNQALTGVTRVISLDGYHPEMETFALPASEVSCILPLAENHSWQVRTIANHATIDGVPLMSHVEPVMRQAGKLALTTSVGEISYQSDDQVFRATLTLDNNYKDQLETLNQQGIGPMLEVRDQFTKDPNPIWQAAGDFTQAIEAEGYKYNHFFEQLKQQQAASMIDNFIMPRSRINKLANLTGLPKEQVRMQAIKLIKQEISNSVKGLARITGPFIEDLASNIAGAVAGYEPISDMPVKAVTSDGEMGTIKTMLDKPTALAFQHALINLAKYINNPKAEFLYQISESWMRALIPRMLLVRTGSSKELISIPAMSGELIITSYPEKIELLSRYISHSDKLIGRTYTPTELSYGRLMVSHVGSGLGPVQDIFNDDPVNPIPLDPKSKIYSPTSNQHNNNTFVLSSFATTGGTEGKHFTQGVTNDNSQPPPSIGFSGYRPETTTTRLTTNGILRYISSHHQLREEVAKKLDYILGSAKHFKFHQQIGHDLTKMKEFENIMRQTTIDNQNFREYLQSQGEGLVTKIQHNYQQILDVVTLITGLGNYNFDLLYVNPDDLQDNDKTDYHKVIEKVDEIKKIAEMVKQAEWAAEFIRQVDRNQQQGEHAKFQVEKAAK